MHHGFHPGLYHPYQFPWLPPTSTGPIFPPQLPPQMTPWFPGSLTHGRHENLQRNQYQHMINDLSRCLEKEIMNSFPSQPHEPAKGKGRRGRKRSSTVSTNSTRQTGNIGVQADDKSVMLDYYLEEAPAKRQKSSHQKKPGKKIRKASSTGTLADYIALSKAPDDEKILSKIPKKELPTMIPQFLRLKEIGSKISIQESDPEEDDLFFLDPPCLVIDLPEESPVDDEVCPSQPVSSPERTALLPDKPTSTPSPERRTPAPQPLQKPSSSPISEGTDDTQSSVAKEPPVYNPPSFPRQETAPETSESSSNQPSTSQGKFMCKRCSHHFPSISRLVQHRKSCTTTSKSAQEFACTVCESSFSSSKACADHWKEYHSSERPHQCRTCGRRFTLIRALQKHIWTHC